MIREIFSWTIFCPFTPSPLPPPNNPENQNFEKMKKTLGDIIILHKCTINDNHVIYGSCDINCNRQIFLSSQAIFCPFTLPSPPNSPKKGNIKKNEKNTWRYHFTSVPKIMIIGYNVPEIWHVTDVIVIFHFGLFFALLPP